jgi:Putative zinc-binding metallo-peptidase
MTPKHIDLDHITEEQLLLTRIRDLPISIAGTWLEECVKELYAELDNKGLVFHPECYLADEWLTPEGEVAIGIPFYLAHPALIRLERRMMLEAEGEGKPWCMQLLRHEAGHAFSYAYNLHKRHDWQKVFGSPRQEYGNTYKFKPYSKSYVRHLDGFYAQYHPDEDFVETFAVWLTPDADWRNKYQGWNALDKLRFVDGLMSSIKGVNPLKPRGKKFWHHKNLTITLDKYYKRKYRHEEEEFPDFHDVQLEKIFTALTDEEWWAFKKDRRKNKEMMTAQELIRTHSKNILNSIDRCTGERKYIINDLLKNIALRAKQLHMIVSQPQSPPQAGQAVALMQLSIYVTSLTMNYIHTGWLRGTRHR